MTVSDHTVETTSWELSSGSTTRRYLILRRSGRLITDGPVVVDLHGSGLSPEAHARTADLSSVVGQSNTVFVLPAAATPFTLIPDMEPGTAWSVPGTPLPSESEVRCDPPDDVEFIDTLIDDLIDRHGAHPQRIHVRGYSGGARLASHLGVALADRLASITCVSGIRFPRPQPQPDDGGPAVLAIHGRLDSFNPYDGSDDPRWDESVPAAVGRWAEHRNCTIKQHWDLGDNAREDRFLDANGFSPVRLITIDDAAHSWPGTTDGEHIKWFGLPGTFNAARAHQHLVAEIDSTTGH